MSWYQLDLRLSGVDRYGYKLSTQNSFPCGGADVWLGFQDARGIFCGGTGNGRYCPDSVTEEVCEKGHYCRVGSTVETKCSFLTQCSKEGLTTQDLKTYGILLIVVIFIILLLIYNCSDLVMHAREKRKSRARTIAARDAHERVSAVERWKRAKEAAKSAKRKAIKISGGVARSLSRTKSKISSTPGAQNPSQAATQTIDSQAEQPLSGLHTVPRPGLQFGAPIDMNKAAYEQESHLLRNTSTGYQEPWQSDRYSVEPSSGYDLYEAVHVPPVGEVSTVREANELQKMSPSLAHTRSQIYKYAYGQIEKERLNQHAKPSSVKDLVDSDAFREMLQRSTRLQMEVSFVDLSLILNGSGKKILSHVTGKFSPFRVTAVMGPSGAGKTTFLNALAGKETGSQISGQVFINGRPGSIQSYKRIIGFVPQDDIVHGSLTVEENLSFSAKYRLPVNTPKQERVLVVERIISGLALTSIRDSLVGTVENRGISGGQRKRVNVGMELVIEPSLLILDEPTSGLDSTSSRLVVQSLRREAALGVNVCVVLHQPSYGLFRMFDDVMLLAKGGYTVYLGPVDEIEAYFSSLGFIVPDRINPPDYFMDVLEGISVPENDPSFDIKSLPVLWMCHNGHHIPLDLQEPADGTRRERDDPLRISYDAPTSLPQEVWDEVRVYVLVRWHVFKTAFSTTEDLSGRRTPGFITQYRLIVERVTKQKFRESRLLAQDYIILLLAGVCLGIMADWTDSNLGGKGYSYTIIAVALLVMIAALRTFTADKLEFWRESSSGINRVAFFLAKDTVDHFNTLVKPAVYLSMFYFFNDPRSSFTSNYIITLALVYCSTGLAYVLAIVLNPQPAQLFSVFIPVIAILLVSSTRTGVLETLTKLDYAHYALEAYTIANAKRYTGVWLITRCEILRKSGYRLDHYFLCLGILFGYGIGARIVALLCLVLSNRKRQK